MVANTSRGGGGRGGTRAETQVGGAIEICQFRNRRQHVKPDMWTGRSRRAQRGAGMVADTSEAEADGTRAKPYAEQGWDRDRTKGIVNSATVVSTSSLNEMWTAGAEGHKSGAGMVANTSREGGGRGGTRAETQVGGAIEMCHFRNRRQHVKPDMRRRQRGPGPNHKQSRKGSKYIAGRRRLGGWGDYGRRWDRDGTTGIVHSATFISTSSLMKCGRQERKGATEEQEWGRQRRRRSEGIRAKAQSEVRLRIVDSARCQHIKPDEMWTAGAEGRN
jgi:hypothetical protein